MRKQYIQPNVTFYKLQVEQQILGVTGNVKVYDYSGKNTAEMQEGGEYGYGDIGTRLEEGDGSDFN